MLLNLGCGTLYAPGWCNLDAVEREETHPDVVVDPADPFVTFGHAVADKVYLGHLLEHVPWPDVPRLLAQVHAVLKVGGEVMVVGPDVPRSLDLFRQGRIPRDLMDAVLEGDHHWVPAEEPGTHKWNCSEARVVGALERAEFVDVTAVPVLADYFTGWPNTEFSEWQCAAKARRA